MIISFSGYEIPNTQSMQLSIDSSHDFPEVRYHATVGTLERLGTIPSLVLIPYGLGDRDIIYAYQSLIRHIRFSENDLLARVPILVIGEGASESVSVDNFVELDDVGISFIDQLPSDLSECCSRTPDNKKLQLFLRNNGNEPEKTGSRHDEANRWGAFAIIYSLQQIDRSLDDRVKAISDHLLEDLYYKKLVARLRKTPPAPDTIARLRAVRISWERLASEVGRPLSILIVEDEIDKGWDVAYQALMGPAGYEYAASYDEACGKGSPSQDLVLLDIRLKDGVTIGTPPKESDLIASLPGVRVAKKFRECGLHMPIVVVTASNKAWTLSELLHHQIDAYWIKPHPSTEFTSDHVLERTIQLYESLVESLSWSRKTRGWIDDLYTLSDDIRVGARLLVAQEFSKKIRSFHALLVQAFSPASTALAEGLQFDIGYLITFSMINELTTWCCDWEVKSENESLLKLGTDQAAPWIVKKVGQGDDQVYFLNGDLCETLRVRDRYDQFPDVPVFRSILHLLNLAEQQRKFKNLAKFRNRLSLTHGKVGDKDPLSSFKAAPDSISSLIDIFKNVVAARRTGLAVKLQ